MAKRAKSPGADDNHATNIRAQLVERALQSVGLLLYDFHKLLYPLLPLRREFLRVNFQIDSHDSNASVLIARAISLHLDEWAKGGLKISL